MGAGGLGGGRDGSLLNAYSHSLHKPWSRRAIQLGRAEQTGAIVRYNSVPKGGGGGGVPEGGRIRRV